MKGAAADVITQLLRTEKGTGMAAQRKYLFVVDRTATKQQIRRGVEDLFKVKVLHVNTAVVPGKPRRVGFRWGWKSNWKKAVVTLSEGSKIEVAT